MAEHPPYDPVMASPSCCQVMSRGGGGLGGGVIPEVLVAGDDPWLRGGRATVKPAPPGGDIPGIIIPV